jgi:hypothetical protein
MRMMPVGRSNVTSDRFYLMSGGEDQLIIRKIKWRRSQVIVVESVAVMGLVKCSRPIGCRETRLARGPSAWRNETRQRAGEGAVPMASADAAGVCTAIETCSTGWQQRCERKK